MAVSEDEEQAPDLDLAAGLEEVGKQFRAQRRQAFEVIEEIKSQFDAPIVTHVLDSSTFWEAEDYHHDYFALNPEQAYCQMVIAPKLKKFYQRFQDLLVKS